MSQDTETRPCPVCGVNYAASLIRLRWGRQTTCSRKCSYILRGRAKQHELRRCICATCGAEFDRRASGVENKYGHVFCARRCHYRGRSLGLVQRVVTKPYNIGETARAAWRVGALKVRDTRRARDNYRKSPETIAKLSIATAHTLAKSKRMSSKLEDVVAGELDLLGAVYQRQFAIRDDGGRFAALI